MPRKCALIAVAAVAALASPAGADVPLPGTQPEDFQDPALAYAPLEAPSGCSTCHGDYDGAQLIEPWDTYMGSAMGAAGLDPVFLAALSIAEADVPGVGDLCLRCHTPDAWLQGRSEPGDGSALLPEDEGISCHFCHRLVDSDPTGRDPNAPYLGNAQFFLSPLDVRRGPYDDADTAPHEWAQSDYLVSAALCGLCHEVSNPLVPWRDEGGNELGPEFPVERTYSEWLRSDFSVEGTSCQDCHMPSLAGKACQLGRAPERPEVPTHPLVGGNHWLPLALGLLYPDDPARVAAWDAASAAAQQMLRDSAELAFEALPATVARDTDLGFTVRVTNLTGHRLPTGYPEGRRMWLEVVVTDAAGATVLASGTYDLASDERQQDLALRAYEVELGIAGQGQSFHFVLNDVVLLDTRIPPRGYAPVAGDSGLAPVGRDYGDGQGGYRHWDLAPYAARVPCDAVGPLQVRVRMLQQSLSPEYIGFLQDAQTTPLGVERAATLADVWNQTGRIAPFLMEELSGTVDVNGQCLPPPDAGVDASVGQDAGGGIDAGGGTDAGGGLDAGAGVDAGPGLDAGIPADAGTGDGGGAGDGGGPGEDAGAGRDAGTGEDAGTGFDAGPGADAGDLDGGADGGCCAVAPGAGGRDAGRGLAALLLVLAAAWRRRSARRAS